MGRLDFLTRTPDRRIGLALFFLCATLYFPFAGNYGLWDPWETHYSEVARQMIMRHDWVSLWWPGSPQDRNEFWSKPVLTFWLMSLGLGVAGLERAGHAFDGEMAVGWTAEWAVRTPFILCGIACVWAVWYLTRRLAGRRAGLWAGAALATSAQFFYVSRQAMTDMAFVAPIAVALCFGGLALLLPADEVESELPRFRWWRFSLPKTTAFFVLLAVLLLVTVPQLAIFSWQVPVGFNLGRHAFRVAGVVGMLPWILALAAYLWLLSRATCRRQIYLHIAFVMCGLSTLAKGPAGVGLPVIVVLLYLLVQGEYRRFVPDSPKRVGAWIERHPLELAAGVLLFAAVACPWYHAMLIRHGTGFWNEFIGDNYVHRAAGRHGDRGTFEYYILQVGHGMFPWTGFVAASLVASLARLRGPVSDARGKLRLFALLWFFTMFMVMSLVNTKFHHYILPGLPGLAILIGLFIDDLLASPSRREAAALLGLGVPLVALAGRDLAMYPARLLWLFDYDYVNAPNGGRPWPPGEEYDYKARLAVWAIVATAATLWFAVDVLRRARRAEAPAAELAAPSKGTSWLLGLIPLVTLVAAQLWQPKFGDRPTPLAHGWILVGAASGLLLLVLLAHTRRLALLTMGIVACLWTGWGLDRLLTDVSPHWSQKQLLATYYQTRANENEPLIAWQLYWRGENFYTKNTIYDHRLPQKEKTVFVSERNAEKLQDYFRSHPGRRVFFVIERARFESLRALLPEAARSSLRAIDESNNKVYLAVAQI